MAVISWRRLERDLHDAVQQGLIALALNPRGLGAMMPADLPRLRARITEIGDGLIRVLGELRECQGRQPVMNTIDQTSAEDAESPNISCARVGYAIRPTVWASVERS
ncbi:histidine kinase dimerization/phosphoacceptor domain-containing protein [Nocardia sp. CA-084685]|uniref:histidine kinase dimerization/phosphoacceptor domain-containing protein n=1 Tax=Nocardia sp. CA-084685 TaxID=3239970 RepID=UPI003D97DFF6